ncbi:hypothetical protein AYL99_10276 [Fonsecaea erecta]|uniref:Uncharacterized protein n=1 Tax=Fonsecaea erecta TaxID=1367422 RepID=A0A178Z803_9EURO|nr:hypothetical protein AYL99_10276 [Fonsecaea erecta]OAP55303.1 hypothetical protein AYL99_10276 [Fonsecaea erecta]
MSIVFTQTAATQYVPKYLFVSGDCQRGTGKSRHVMKEFLRKRESIRRQKQLAARSRSRVLPWLRREDVEQVPTSIIISPAVGDGGPSDTSSDSSSRPSSPRQSQHTESHPSPCFTPPCSSPEKVERKEGGALDSSYNPQELLDHLHHSVISRLYETDQSSNINSPATVMVNHVIPRTLPARILLAISSFHRDIEAGHPKPSSGTLSLILEGIGSLKEHLKSPSAVSDDTILAVINLWEYEVTLSMGSARSGADTGSTQENILPKSVTENIRTHLTGLQRSIECHGGLHSLSPETLWLFAWCVCTLPGYSPIDVRMMSPNDGSNMALRKGPESSFCPSRLFETLSKVHVHTSSGHFRPNVLQETSFSALRTVLRRLNAMRRALHGQMTPMSRLRKSTSLVSTLLFIFDVCLEATDSVHGGGSLRTDQLATVQKRFVDHRIDQEGSLEKVWQVLMTQQETPQLRLHPRTWSIVEMVNAIKHLKISTIDALSRLLLGYLLPEVCDYNEDAFRCDKVLLQVYFELEGLADLT